MSYFCRQKEISTISNQGGQPLLIASKTFEDKTNFAYKYLFRYIQHSINTRIHTYEQCMAKTGNAL